MLFWRRSHAVRDEDLSAFVDGELDDAALGRVESHLESCAACRETVVELRAVGRALSELPRARAPRSFALRQADVETGPAPLASGLFGSTQPLLSGVAAIALVAFVVLVGVDITSTQTSDSFDSAPRLSGQTESVSDAAELAPVAPEAQEGFTGAETGDGDVLSGDTATNDDDAAKDGEPRSQEVERAAPAVGAEETSYALPPDEGDDRTGLHAGEAAAAAVALVAGGLAATIWWRRRRRAVV